MFSNNSEFILHENASEREKRYSEFYSKIIHDHFDMEETFISKVKEIVDSGNAKSAFELLEYTSQPECYQCAYLLQFAVFDTSFTIQNFYESALEYGNIIKMFICKRRINVCCLGSQAVFAVVGLCKMIEESVQQFGFLDDVPSQIQVFIVEKNPSWKRLCERIVDATNKEHTKLKLKLDFFVEDMKEHFSQEVKLRIKKSHIITTVRYLSRLSSASAVAKITKKILTNMKKNAILFHLDNEAEGQYKTMKDLIAKDMYFSKIMCSRVPEKYISHEGTKSSLINLYQYIPNFNSVRNINIAPVIYSTGIKNREIKLKSVLEMQQKEKMQNMKKLLDTGYRAKRSNNKLRHSTDTFILDGRFASIDMEKRNRDDSNRHIAKNVAVSRYVNFDDFWMDY